MNVSTYICTYQKRSWYTLYNSSFDFTFLMHADENVIELYYSTLLFCQWRTIFYTFLGEDIIKDCFIVPVLPKWPDHIGTTTMESQRLSSETFRREG